ncbi:hypothetical protein COW36_02860 [bacterium (Candidatus Blackallbacteria) CG17_big_fil_post_rev_8_21_14_2_50_48_46]|uniref:Radical SAM core domain-containing protein n=1 Tax=bacterium (Candidatus Blackallbacteria) CG17_big_fil_post_rev_8_21_14_2_50_48_46 TaxID=2014261 RepID=A0A2M7GA94_9BACT|nr:MAG: hypothetical protein COW64_12615 [bacterium (Candidatus Blackallbacteria) CG18_big_fil_WC_8_21_14_2_50_49_26]PIW19068.1 MAG: hypothetical protein COW36_02860 [bacterium (Candidatus Blackallbacteria) CG17_big_fil_post_rev_8_21_14_2_50_48_46]PIW44565.1 MAG: hypothetical protein COW20_23260 [bacterium (Candidatus Blackallbacteria) CG13_big_fil_rev_8_21_14_2_50_49_14]
MLSIQELRELCAQKKIYLWGAMIVGQGVCRSLERIGVPVEAFLDSSPSLQGQKALGYPICKPDSVFDSVRSGEGLIIISSGHHDLEIAQLCEQAGLSKNRDFILSKQSLNDLDPSVEVTGMCNLQCISCPRGNDNEPQPKGFMSAETYRLVLEKLLREIPLLGSVQLYTWGEPLLNKELPEIIAMTREAKVLTAISSNLNYVKNLEHVIAAKPDWFKVSCSGWEDSYEITHTGGKWNKFYPNLHTLAALRDQHHPEMHITLSYHLYKHNLDDDYKKMEALCEKLNLIFRPSPAYLYPMDTVRDFVDGNPISAQATRTLPLLMMDLNEGIAKARERKHLPCPEERCLPIDWDGRVRACGVYFRPYVVNQFLETPLAEIVGSEKKKQLCAECIGRGIHQFTSVYLPEQRIQVATVS